MGLYLKVLLAVGLATVPAFFCLLDDNAEEFLSAFRLVLLAKACLSCKLMIVVPGVGA